MKIILARHGNTFGPGDTPVWVGAKEDLPLVEKGLNQSKAIGNWLAARGLVPDRIIAGPLKRTRTGAEILSDILGYAADKIDIEPRLKEIEYGSWGGKSDAEIEALFGMSVIEDWRERTIVPADADWSPSPDQLKANARSVLAELTASDAETVLLISSNGILRYFHEVWYLNADIAPSAKVKTGHMCLAEWDGVAFLPQFWNLDPATE